MRAPCATFGPAPAPAIPTYGWILLLLAPLFMASNIVIGRAAMEVIPPIGLAFWRWVLAFLMLLPFAWSGLRRHRPTLLRQWRLLLLLGLLGMAMSGSFVYLGLQTTTATNAGLIYAGSPIMIVLFSALFLGERLTLLRAVGIVLSLSGVVTVLTHGAPETLLSLRFHAGDLWVLAAATAWAVYSVTLKRDSLALPTMTVFAAVAAGGVLCLLPFYLLETALGAPVRPTGPAMLSIFGVALFASVLSYSCYQKGIALVGPSRAGPFLYLMPIYAALLAVLLLGESFQSHHAIGLALILPGIACASMPVRR